MYSVSTVRCRGIVWTVLESLVVFSVIFIIHVWMNSTEISILVVEKVEDLLQTYKKHIICFTKKCIFKGKL